MSGQVLGQALSVRTDWSRPRRGLSPTFARQPDGLPVHEEQVVARAGFEGDLARATPRPAEKSTSLKLCTAQPHATSWASICCLGTFSGGSQA